jgi:hypothetical protein
VIDRGDVKRQEAEEEQDDGQIVRPAPAPPTSPEQQHPLVIKEPEDEWSSSPTLMAFRPQHLPTTISVYICDAFHP